MDKKILEELVNSIAQAAKKILGVSAFTMIGNISGIKVEKEKIVVFSESGDIVKNMIKEYEKIIGPASKTIVISGSVPIIKKYKNKSAEFKKILPSWVFESPDMKALEMTGVK